MQTCFRRSELEQRGPGKDLKFGPRSSRGVRSAPLFAQIPNLPMKAAVRGVRRLPEACPKPAHHTGCPKHAHTQPISHWHL
eukprot:11544094-Alexandrium_andersonii.AAC.1